VNIRNKGGTMRFERPAASSWNTGLWATLLVTAGTAYWYRNELRIIGRGIMAGANLAIERWEKKREEKEMEKNERPESVRGPPAHTKDSNNTGVQCPGCQTTFNTRTEYNGHRLTNSCPVVDAWRRAIALQSQAQEVPAFPPSLRTSRPNWKRSNVLFTPCANDDLPKPAEMGTAAANPVWRKAHANEAAEQIMIGDAIAKHSLEVTPGHREGGVQLTPESSDAYEGDAEDGEEKFQRSEERSSSRRLRYGCFEFRD
jgi:hypothetical protein